MVVDGAILRVKINPIISPEDMLIHDASVDQVRAYPFSNCDDTHHQTQESRTFP